MGNWQTLWLKRQPFTKLRVYTYKKGMQKTMQNIHRTLHNTLHQFDYLNVMQCMIYDLNPTQTLHWNLHKPYTNPTLKPAKNLHWRGQNPTLKPAKNLHWRGQNPTQKLYTKAYTATLHSVFWTRIKRMERMNANESCGTNETNVASLQQAGSALSL